MICAICRREPMYETFLRFMRPKPLQSADFNSTDPLELSIDTIYVCMTCVCAFGKAYEDIDRKIYADPKDVEIRKLRSVIGQMCRKLWDVAKETHRYPNELQDEINNIANLAISETEKLEHDEMWKARH